MRAWIYKLSIGIILISSWSCGLTDRDQPIPYYLDLKDVQVLEPNSNILGTHKITDIWVFADGQIQGVYPLPVKAPITWEDKASDFIILPGVRYSGMNDTPILYPFFKGIEFSLKPNQLQTYTIPLTFEYVDDCKFSINEGFEDGNIFNHYFDPNSESRLEVTDKESRTGTKSAAITLKNANVFTEIGCATQVVKGQNLRGSSFVEFDYKGEGEIAVGIAKTLGNITTIEYFLFVPARNDWNRIYVDFTDKTSPNDYDTYRIILGFTKTGYSAETTIYLDNIKHIHF
ncbi:MAG: hypothetical protein LC107_02780 [Chitinophagales bacterium]|nr:hypothetical protein [Chitinophagales bacterium]